MKPGISVIIAHYNAPQKLRACVESVLANSYSDYEVIVVDDASPEDITSHLSRITDARLRIIKLPENKGSGFARNRGAEAASYDIVHFIDADAILPKDSLTRVAKAIYEEKYDGVIGVVDSTPLNPGFVPNWVAEETNYLGMRASDEPHQFLIALCGAIRRDAYFHFGGFHHRFIDDFEFDSRLPSSVRIKTDKGLHFQHHYSGWLVNLKKQAQRAFYFSQLEKKPFSPWFSPDRRNSVLASLALVASFPLGFFNNALFALSALSLAAFLFFSRELLGHHLSTKGLFYTVASATLKFTISLSVGIGGVLGSAVKGLQNARYAILRLSGPARIYLRPNSPTYTILYITARCNSRCSYCFQWEILNEPKRVKRELSVIEYERLAKSMGIMEHITLGGGEPFLRRDLGDIAYAFYKYCGVRNISIPTNGTRPDLVETVGADILKRCPKATIKISLSIDGVGDEHDKLRGAIGNYPKLIECDKVLRKLRTQYKNLYYIINTCYNGKNQDSVLATIKENRKRFDHDIQVSTFVRGSVANEEEKVVDINKYYDIVEYLEQIQTIEKKGGGYLLDTLHQALQMESRVNIKKVLTEGKSKYTCTAGRNMVVIDDIGNVNACEILPGKFSFGNLREFDMDLTKMMAQKRVKETQSRIRKEKCFCTWECAQLNSIVYSPVGFATLFKHMWGLYRRRKVLQSVKSAGKNIQDFEVFQSERKQVPVLIPNIEPVHPMVLEGSSLNPFNIESENSNGEVKVSDAMNEEELKKKRERWLRPVQV